MNLNHPRFQEILKEKPEKKKKRVHVLAIGDVGSTLLTGLHLLGGDVISSIGICDISDKVTARWEFEENQIAYPWDYDALPEVDVVKPEELFQCDVFVFVASKGIPPVGSEVKDVRMYQLRIIPRSWPSTPARPGRKTLRACSPLCPIRWIRWQRQLIWPAIQTRTAFLTRRDCARSRFRATVWAS